jgi:hypothetical protein
MYFSSKVIQNMPHFDILKNRHLQNAHRGDSAGAPVISRSDAQAQRAADAQQPKK